jgi:hypothetical protein
MVDLLLTLTEPEVVELQDTLVQVETQALLEQVELVEAVVLLLINCYLVAVA